MFAGNPEYSRYSRGKKGEEVFGVSPAERAPATNRADRRVVCSAAHFSSTLRLVEGKCLQIDVAARQDNADS